MSQRRADQSISRNNRIQSFFLGGVLFLVALLLYFRFPDHLRAVQIVAGITGAVGIPVLAFAKYRREAWFVRAILLSLAIQPVFALLVWKRLPFTNSIEAALVGSLDAIVCGYVFARFGPSGMMPGR